MKIKITLSILLLNLFISNSTAKATTRQKTGIARYNIRSTTPDKSICSNTDAMKQMCSGVARLFSFNLNELTGIAAKAKKDHTP
ncbi:MAG: hypothetical protein EOP00_33700, partial [Pedobacter sp.]